MDDLLLVFKFGVGTFETEKTSERQWSQNNGMRLWIEDVLGTEGSFKMARSVGGSRVDSESCGFLEENYLVARIRVNILMQVKFWPLKMPLTFPLARLCGSKVGEAKIFGWIVNAFRIHYDACRQRSMRRISLDYCDFSEINCELHSWLSIVT